MTFTTFFKSSMVTRAEEATTDDRAILQARRDAYRIVDRRDGMFCRVCRRRVERKLANRDERMEHHHINGRGRLDKETTENICVTCTGCHNLRHVKRTLSISGNADKKLRFEQEGRVWNG